MNDQRWRVDEARSVGNLSGADSGQDADNDCSSAG